jgi:hypothetical protein
MPTNSLVTHTRSVSIAAPADAVLELVGDPEQLPRWAPTFAPAIHRRGEDWIVERDGGELAIRVRVSPELGTVDFLDAGAQVRAFSRVVGDACASGYLFTVLLPADADAQAVDAQMAVIEQELRTVRDLCERHAVR